MKFKTFAIFTLFSGILTAADELNQLDALIQVTQQNVKTQMALKEDIKTYLDLQSQYLKDPNNKELLLKTARSATIALDHIKAANLTHTFSKDFMAELTLFAQIGQKKGIPKP